MENGTVKVFPTSSISDIFLQVENKNSAEMISDCCECISFQDCPVHHFFGDIISGGMDLSNLHRTQNAGVASRVLRAILKEAKGKMEYSIHRAIINFASQLSLLESL